MFKQVIVCLNVHNIINTRDMQQLQQKSIPLSLRAKIINLSENYGFVKAG